MGVLLETGNVYPSRAPGSVLLIFKPTYDVMFVLFVFCVLFLMLPLALDCPYLIAASVFSNVYYKA